MDFIFSRQALRDLRKLDKQTQKRIVDKLEFIASSSSPLNFAEKLIDSTFGEWRFRIGDYRAIFDVKEKQIVILKIGHRKEIYR